METKKTTTKGKLLKWKSLHYGIDKLNTKEGIKEIRDKIKKEGTGGIYALYNDKTLYYVGLTKGKIGRITNHKTDKHKGKWNSFRIFRIRYKKYLEDIETIVIMIAQPIGNSSKKRNKSFQRVMN